MDSSQNPRVALRVALLSLACLAAAVLGASYIPETAADFEVLLWLLAILPAFLLAYYRGWRGAAMALAAGMVVLAFTPALGPLLGREVGDWPLLIRVLAVFFGSVVGVATLSELLYRARSRAEELELTDRLTELPNRRFASLMLEREFAAAERGRPLTVVLFDVDGFRQYNDRFGRAAGDDALRRFSEILRQTTRRMNLSARYGGEEFLSVLSAGETDGTLVFVDKVKSALAAAANGTEAFTVSAGVATYAAGMRTPDDLLRAADRALMQARLSGRGGVRVYQDSERVAQTQQYVQRVREILNRPRDGGPATN